MDRPTKANVSLHDWKGRSMRTEALAIIAALEARLEELDDVGDARSTVIELRSVLTDLRTLLGSRPN